MEGFLAADPWYGIAFKQNCKSKHEDLVQKKSLVETLSVSLTRDFCGNAITLIERVQFLAEGAILATILK